MLSAKQKAEADNTHRDLGYLGYYKTEFHNCFIIHGLKRMTTITPDACNARATYRLVSYLLADN